MATPNVRVTERNSKTRWTRLTALMLVYLSRFTMAVESNGTYTDLEGIERASYRNPHYSEELTGEAVYIPPAPKVDMYLADECSSDGESLKGPDVTENSMCLIASMEVNGPGYDLFLFDCFATASDRIEYGVTLLDEQGCIVDGHVNEVSGVYYPGENGGKDIIVRQISFRKFHFLGMRNVQFICQINVCQACPDHPCQRHSKVPQRNVSQRGKRSQPVVHEAVLISPMVQVYPTALSDIDNEVTELKVEGDMGLSSIFLLAVCSSSIGALSLLLAISVYCVVRCQLKKKSRPVQEI